MTDKYFKAADRALKEGDPKGALEALQQVLKADSRNQDALIQIARIFLDLGKDREAGRVLGALHKVNPAHPEGTAYLLRVLATEGDATALARLEKLASQEGTTFFAPWAYGQALLRLKQPKKAIPAFEEALKRAPNEGHAVAYLGLAKAQAGDVDGAAAALTEAARLLPKDSAPVAALATVMAQHGKIGHAVKALEEAVARNPDRVDLYPELIRLYIFGKMFKQALKVSLDLRMRVAKSAEGAYLQGLSLLLLGRPDEAHKVLADARALAPDSQEVLLAQSRVALMRKDFDGGYALIKPVLEKDPGNVALVNELAVLLLSEPKKPRLAEAQAVLQSALKQHPDDAGLHLNLALTLADQKPAEAKPHAQAALKSADQSVKEQAERLLKVLK